MLLRKPVFEYYMQASFKGMLWFLLIWTGIFILTTIGMASITVEGDGVVFFGTELAFFTSFLIGCMSSFTAELHFMFQHGVSRRSAFGSFVLHVFAMGAVYAAVLYGSTVLFNAIGDLLNLQNHSQMFDLFYAARLETMGVVPRILTTFLFLWGVLSLAGVLGYLVTLIFYRLNKIGKTLLGGAAVALAITLPFLNMITGGRIWQFALWFWALFRGGDEFANPWRGTAVFFALTAILLVPCWLLIRRLKMKK